ncbi:MAG: DUF1569 domain-containing protein [Bacteroidota bacterium]
MKTIFDQGAIAALANRINNLDYATPAQWGKMDVGQMMRHCTENDRMLLRQKSFKRLLIGRLIGKAVLRSSIADDTPLKKNSPTHPDLKIKQFVDPAQEKAVWLSLLAQYSQLDTQTFDNFVHPFFGRMNKEEVGIFAYKHIDHHLRQFSA